MNDYLMIAEVPFASLLLVMQIVGGFTAIKAIMETRTAQGAIAWTLALLLLPWIALPAYWVFGPKKFAGYVTLRQAKKLKASTIARQLANEFERIRMKNVSGRKEENFLERLAGLPFTIGNRVELLINGAETFAAIFAAIAEAKDYVLVQFYLIHDDALGKKLRDALIDRAKSGVRCLVLFDEIGSGRLPHFTKELRANGVKIFPFNSTKGLINRWQINFRNHRKIVIVDGRKSFVGGHNVGVEYLGLDKKIGQWRDTHVQMEGPVVQCLQISWLEDWLWATGEALQGLNWVPDHPPGTNVGAICLPSGPADSLETATLFFLHAIHSAKSRLWIASPYFVPDEQFISALQLAALRGVDVRILIPKNPDSSLVRLSNFSYLEETVKVGIRWFRYSSGFMHQKVLLVDDDFATVGTANFDNRSFRLNFEITMAFYEKAFAEKVATMLLQDFERSRLVSLKEVTRSSWWFRLKVGIARLLSPIQ